MACSDHTTRAWLHGFNDVGELIFGKPADELVEMKVGGLVNGFLG